MLVGYARVSTVEQDTAMQLDALAAAGVKKVYQEKGSGVGPRPQLHVALRRLRPGDTLVVWKLDRIARSLADLLSIIQRVKDAGASIKSLTEPIDTSSPIGEFTLQVLGAVAQLERSMIRERTIAGQVSALKRGVRFGRPRITTPEQDRDIRRRLRAGESQVSIARSYGFSPEVVRRVADRTPKKTGTLPVLGRFL